MRHVLLRLCRAAAEQRDETGSDGELVGRVVEREDLKSRFRRVLLLQMLPS